MRHAAGPWRLKQHKGGRLHVLSSIGAQIAALWNCKDRDANAHLIAAAPEMYEMLERVETELRHAIGEINDMRMARVCGTDLTPPDLWDAETCYDVAVLLAKARGETDV